MPAAAVEYAIANGTSFDHLSFTNQNGITGSYNGAAHILNLTGSASVAARSVANMHHGSLKSKGWLCTT